MDWSGLLVIVLLVALAGCLFFGVAFRNHTVASVLNIKVSVGVTCMALALVICVLLARF